FRSSGLMPPRPFISSLTRPFLPSAETRTASRASRSAASATADKISLFSAAISASCTFIILHPSGRPLGIQAADKRKGPSPEGEGPCHLVRLVAPGVEHAPDRRPLIRRRRRGQPAPARPAP